MPDDCIAQLDATADAVIARLSGSLTVANAPELRHGLLDAVKKHGPKTLALNLNDVDFIDSSALGVFVEVRRSVAAGGGTLALTNLNDDIRGLMRIMNLDAVFTFLDDVSQVASGS